MSKMIKIDRCQDCKYFFTNIVGETRWFCKKLFYDGNKGNYVINFPSKILENCPLDDYPGDINFTSKAKGLVENKKNTPGEV